MTIIVVKGSLQTAIAYGVWFPLVIALFAFVNPRRAMIFSFIFAWLFLPVAFYYIPGLPNITKMVVTSSAVFIGTVLFNPNAILQFRPRWYDIPIVLYCIANVPTSISNGLGFYDGFTGIIRDGFVWALPYFLGRVYINDASAMREVAYAIFMGGIAYVPFVLYETRMSPQLHRMVYGYFPHAFMQTVRYGGWRANVFMEHGLMVGMWLTASTVSGCWLRLSGSLRKIYNVPVELYIAALVLTSVLQKSTGALVLLATGLGVMAAVHYSQRLLPLTAMASACAIYVLVRSFGFWDGALLVETAEKIFAEDRVRSLNSRIEGERILGDHARKRPLLGWGGWGRNFVRDEKDRRLAITDSMWISVFSTNGYFGLTAFMTSLLLPIFRISRHVKPPLLRHPTFAPTIAMATVLGLWACDNLMNAMFNPIFVVIAGGLAGMQPQAFRVQPKRHVRFVDPPRRPVVYSR